MSDYKFLDDLRYLLHNIVGDAIEEIIQRAHKEVDRKIDELVQQLDAVRKGEFEREDKGK